MPSGSRRRNRRGRRKGGIANPYRDEELRPLRLTADEKHALETFLRALSGRVQEGWAER